MDVGGEAAGVVVDVKVDVELVVGQEQRVGFEDPDELLEPW